MKLVTKIIINSEDGEDRIVLKLEQSRKRAVSYELRRQHEALVNRLHGVLAENFYVKNIKVS